MAMTINDDIVMIECVYQNYKNRRVGDRRYRIRAALEHTIKNLHKYQKIQEIVKSWREVGLDYDSCDAMENIERIIDNGNDD